MAKSDTTKRIEWTLSTGAVASVELTLRLSREVWADGDKVTVPCCEISEVYRAAGHEALSTHGIAPRVAAGRRYTHAAGVIGIPDDVYVQINAAKAELRSHPAWVAKAEAEAAQGEALAMRQADRALCPRCGSYCYGDCTANN